MFQSLVCEFKEKHQINGTKDNIKHCVVVVFLNFEVMRGFCNVFGT